MANYWKTADIKISADSVGCYTAEHTYQGLLIDGNFYENRAACRRDAVEVLKEKKQEELSTFSVDNWTHI